MVQFIDIVIFVIAVFAGINAWGAIGLFVLYLINEETHSTKETVIKAFLWVMALLNYIIDVSERKIEKA